ncbi:MAG: protease modulator HflC [Alphaproteobacteria bacterium]|nr:protease modulator HflC [Alphaproteobacteria bacterium]
MHQLKITILIILVTVVMIVTTSTLYVVDPAQQAIVFQFREKKRVVKDPGLYAKLPFIQDVMYFDKRILPLEPTGQVIILDEQKLLDVDGFARWHITDPFVFFQTLRDERIAVDRLNGLLNSSIRNVLGTVKVSDLLSDKRIEIMERIRDEMNASAVRFGVEVIDVRIRRTDLPRETVQNVFNRMQSERQREAAALRAEGAKIANETQAKADAEVTGILSQAQSEAQKIRGEGDKEALKTLAEATSRDPQFFAFYRSLEAYKVALPPDNTTYVLSPDSEFFKNFSNGGR